MRVFSGIQPSGKIHIGNYLGSLMQWVSFQEKNECIFSVVDLHSLTVPYNPSLLEEKIFEKVIAYLAAGINPKKSIIFIQSQVKEHAELNWLLSVVTPVSELKRMTQYKEKAKKYPKNINAGLLNYPILMAADILLYDTDVVPVGEDQAQHLEMTRLIARNFNKRFGNVFKIPKAFIPKTGEKIMSLTEPTKKMSKSDKNPKSYITLFDSPEEIKKKIMSAQTDSGLKIEYNPKLKPGISNLLTIYSLFSETPINRLEKKFEGKNYKFFKENLADLLIEKLAIFREEKKKFKKDGGSLKRILDEGRKKAQVIAFKKMKKIKKSMGLTI
ncbi:tryptophan--tRNA ligase [bacterium]|nr:tryptophan--tRNA ligase [bacterium]